MRSRFAPRGTTRGARTISAGQGVPMEPVTFVVLQPGYLPWLVFFDKMRRSGVFVYYDDAQFDRHD